MSLSPDKDSKHFKANKFINYLLLYGIEVSNVKLKVSSFWENGQPAEVCLVYFVLKRQKTPYMPWQEHFITF